jgi:15-cis-phytoene synthase
MIPADLPDLRRQAAVATARGSRSFSFAACFFPQAVAEAAHAVYWFCRTTDDMVDKAPDAETGRAALNRWQSELQDAEATASIDGIEDAVLRLFIATVRAFDIPLRYAYELIDGVRMDLDNPHYETFHELRQYCYRVASTVGLMMSHVIGFDGPALAYAEELGVAMQLTNILRDVGEDLRLGRVYLPGAELREFGCSIDDLRQGHRTPEFRRLMQFQISRARDYYRQAEPGIAMLRPEGRFAVRIAADVYERILRRIEVLDYDVLQRRAVVPTSTKYWITARNLAAPAARHSLRRLLGAVRVG